MRNIFEKILYALNWSLRKGFKKRKQAGAELYQAQKLTGLEL